MGVPMLAESPLLMSLYRYSEMELLDHRVMVRAAFWGPALLFSLHLKSLPYAIDLFPSSSSSAPASSSVLYTPWSLSFSLCLWPRWPGWPRFAWPPCDPASLLSDLTFPLNRSSPFAGAWTNSADLSPLSLPKGFSCVSGFHPSININMSGQALGLGCPPPPCSLSCIWPPSPKAEVGTWPELGVAGWGAAVSTGCPSSLKQVPQ